jgi:hypothetical protein
MQTRSTALVNAPGIIAYYKHSLNFLIADDMLLLQSGAVLAPRGTYIELDASSYILCKNLALAFFENKKHYYFYLHKGRVLKEDTSHYLLHNQIDQGLHFIISEEINKEMVLLGEVSIDYNAKDSEGKRVLSIAKNAFSPQANEIDICQRNNIVLNHNIMNEDERHWFSSPLYNLALTLHKKMKAENIQELSILSSAFFAFSETIETSDISYAELYKKCLYHTKLFSWLDESLYEEETNTHFKLLETQVFQESHTYNCEYYLMNKNDEEGFFYSYIKHIENLTESLQHSIPTTKETKEQKKLIELSKDISKDDTYAFEAVLPEAFMFEEETVIESEPALSYENQENAHDDTILIGGNHSSTQYVQIGRSETSSNDIVLGKDDTSISRIHAKITAHEQGFFIEDLSSQGTYVNGERIEKNTKKFVTRDSHIVLGKKGYVLDLSQHQIQALCS